MSCAHNRILASVDETHLWADLIPPYLNVWRDGATAHPGYFASRFADHLPPPDPAGERACNLRCVRSFSACLDVWFT
jgi:hypothetical protein